MRGRSFDQLHSKPRQDRHGITYSVCFVTWTKAETPKLQKLRPLCPEFVLRLVSPDLAEFLAEILDDVSLEMILLFYGWRCRTFQTASHIHVMIHIQCLKPLKQLWMGLWQNTHTATTIDVSPDLGELAEILGWCKKCGDDPTTLWLRL